MVVENNGSCKKSTRESKEDVASVMRSGTLRPLLQCVKQLPACEPKSLARFFHC